LFECISLTLIRPNHNCRGYLWDILRNTLDKTVKRTNTTAQELKAAQDQMDQITSDASSADTIRLQQTREAHQVALRDQSDLLLHVFQVLLSLLPTP